MSISRVLKFSFFPDLIKQYWFMAALLGVCLITLADHSQVMAGLGRWFKNHHGSDLVIVLIFLFSGFSLQPDQLKRGLLDFQGILLAFCLIFLASPLLALLFSLAPLEKGLVIGLYLVAVMPSTLSSGVVMTQAAGGQAGHALVTTICANALSVFTIPFVLSLLLAVIGQPSDVILDKGAIMLKIAYLVVLPLSAGMLLKHWLSSLYSRLRAPLNLLNQWLIIFIVWVAISQTRTMLIHSGSTVGLIVILSAVFHGGLLLLGWMLIKLSGRGRGRRESILLMGGQKTLPLSIILQMSLFPQYGVALLVCVLHHIVHLIMDGYLVERLKKTGKAQVEVSG